jgi:hypothetical protein
VKRYAEDALRYITVLTKAQRTVDWFAPPPTPNDGLGVGQTPNDFSMAAMVICKQQFMMLFFIDFHGIECPFEKGVNSRLEAGCKGYFTL